MTLPEKFVIACERRFALEAERARREDLKEALLYLGGRALFLIFAVAVTLAFFHFEGASLLRLIDR